MHFVKRAGSHGHQHIEPSCHFSHFPYFRYLKKLIENVIPQFRVHIDASECLDVKSKSFVIDYNCEFFYKATLYKTLYPTINYRRVNIDFFRKPWDRNACILGKFAQNLYVKVVDPSHLRIKLFGG